MSVKKGSLIFEKDQELLFKAFAHFISKITSKSIGVIAGMFSTCIDEVAELKKLPPDCAHSFDEKIRKEILEDIIEHFFTKVKVGSFHRMEIKSGCLNIYERWNDIKAGLKEQSDLDLIGLLKDQESSIVGYEDQEILMSAFAHYIHRITGNSKPAIVKLMRVCMLEVTIPEKVSFRETRYLDEQKRADMIQKGIEQYIKKAKISDGMASMIRIDCVKVYERWKEIRRVEPENRPELIVESGLE